MAIDYIYRCSIAGVALLLGLCGKTEDPRRGRYLLDHLGKHGELSVSR